MFLPSHPNLANSLFVRIEYKLIVFPTCRAGLSHSSAPALVELMVSISKIRELINASHDTFIAYSFLSQWKWRPFKDHSPGSYVQ
jgi:hypothetical protein